eukprot:1159881-Pelagomonas_calceolata.AAC.1
MLDRITSLINDVVTKEDSSVKLSPEDVLSLIGRVRTAVSGLRDLPVRTWSPLGVRVHAYLACMQVLQSMQERQHT